MSAANGTRCTEVTAKGKPCTNHAFKAGETLCAIHAAKQGNEEARAYLSEQGRKGARAIAAKRPKRESCQLRTADERLAELERLLLEVESGAGETSKKGAVIVSIIKEAGVVQAEKWEKEIKQLRRMLAEVRPDLGLPV